MIEVKNLVKQYGDKLAVDHISFTVQDGEILGFLGPNGAGKSTTMNIITGYLSSTEGTVTIDGSEILEDPIGAKSKIGYLPEIPPLYMDCLLYTSVGTGWITSSSTQDLRNILLRARSTNPGPGTGGSTITTGIVSGGGQGINVRSGPGTNYPVLYLSLIHI